MKIGLIGLGKMGFNLALNMKKNNVEVIAFNRSPEKLDDIRKKGIKTAYNLEELSNKLGTKKIIWLMVTAGAPVDDMIKQLLPYLNRGDLLIDGGNSFYEDTIRRSRFLSKKGIKFMDVGTSGGIEGARNGACLMIGGDHDQYKRLESIFKSISVKDGFGYMGKVGSGHFTKMVHNGIEYGMMQAIGEGMEVIDKSHLNIDKVKLMKVWNNGSVIRSWLIELLGRAYKKDIKLSKYSGIVGLSGEGEWTVKTAKKLKVPTPIIEGSVKARKISKKSKRYQGKVVQSLRFEFGGHIQPK
jgi:6-phosphogluconate dehydrogenase